MKKSVFVIFFLTASLIYAAEKKGFRGQKRGSILRPHPLITALALINSGVRDGTEAYKIYSVLNCSRMPHSVELNGGKIQIIIKQQASTGQIFVSVREYNELRFMDKVTFPENSNSTIRTTYV